MSMTDVLLKELKMQPLRFLLKHLHHFQMKCKLLEFCNKCNKNVIAEHLLIIRISINLGNQIRANCIVLFELIMSFQLEWPCLAWILRFERDGLIAHALHGADCHKTLTY